MNKGGMEKKHEWFVTLPSFVWLLLFFLIPTCIIFIYALKSQDIYGGIEPGWSLEAISNLFDKDYTLLIFRTLMISAITTAVCILLALPVGYQMAIAPKRFRKLLILMLMLPFWTSFLIRIFAWKALLHPEGFFNNLLAFLHIISPNTTLLYHLGAVLLVTIYTYLPFAIFPIYAAASKFNFQLFEAAMDLGASRSQAFLKVFLPGISKGISTGAMMVFISTTGAYIIPDLVGGFDSEMIGTRIAQKVFVERNLPEASALSILLALVVFLPLLAITMFSSRPKKLELELRNKE